MAIDDGVIDHDHQLLLSIVNDFCEVQPSIGGKPELQRTLARLHHYTSMHLAREELLQTAVRYPQRAAHHLEHIRLVDRLNAITAKVVALDGRAIDALRAAPYDVAFVDTASAETFVSAYSETQNLLRNWLVDHILKSDLPMRPFVEAMRPYAAHMPSLWKAEAATLEPNVETPQAAHSALMAAKEWMPAGFRKERIDQGALPMLHQVANRVHENPVLARMRAEAAKLGMPLELDPTCRDIKDHALAEALALWHGHAGPTPMHWEPAKNPLVSFKENSVLFERCGNRFAVRRAGERFCRMFGEMTGKFLDEAVAPDRLPRWNLLLNGVLDYASPLRILVVSRAFGRDDLMVEAIVAPFHNREKNTAEILAVVSYDAALAGETVAAADPGQQPKMASLL